MEQVEYDLLDVIKLNKKPYEDPPNGIVEEQCYFEPKPISLPIDPNMQFKQYNSSVFVSKCGNIKIDDCLLELHTINQHTTAYYYTTPYNVPELVIKMFKRELLHNEYVYHIDGDFTNNSIDNLGIDFKDRDALLIKKIKKDYNNANRYAKIKCICGGLYTTNKIKQHLTTLSHIKYCSANNIDVSTTEPIQSTEICNTIIDNELIEP
jgi:hypothetical protein